MQILLQVLIQHAHWELSVRSQIMECVVESLFSHRQHIILAIFIKIHVRLSLFLNHFRFGEMCILLENRWFWQLYLSGFLIVLS
jgi:hypothetical protein